MTHFCFVILFVFWVTEIQGAIFINSDQVLEINVSDAGLTRISLEGEGIKDMFVYPGTESVQLHRAGHLFIAPPEDNGPLFVTIISESGLTQDLKLKFIEKKPTPVILKTSQNPSVSKIQLERWMEGALAGAIPRFFLRESPKEEARYTSQVVMQEEERYSNGTHILSLWTVKSREKMEISILLKDLINPDEAGKLMSLTLPALGQTTLVMIKYRKGKKYV